LKKSKSGQEFNKVLTNSKISVFNFSHQAPAFAKKQKSKDVRYPIVKVQMKEIQSVPFDTLIGDLKRDRAARRTANYKSNQDMVQKTLTQSSLQPPPIKRDLHIVEFSDRS
jgi:hypothetical protein